MDVFCGDGWRFFEWELGRDDLPIYHHPGEYTTSGSAMLWDDEEYWNVPQIVAAPLILSNHNEVQASQISPVVGVVAGHWSLSTYQSDMEALNKARTNYVGGDAGGPFVNAAPVLAAKGGSADSPLSESLTTMETGSSLVTQRRQPVLLLDPSTETDYLLANLHHPLADETSKHLVLGAKRNNHDDVLKGNVSFVKGASEQRAKKTKTNATSQFKGVTKHRVTGKYEAHLWDATVIRKGKDRKGRKRGKQIYLGGFTGELAAARTYDMAAICFWGADAVTNFPLGDYARDAELLRATDKESIVKILRRSGGGYQHGSHNFVGLTVGGFLAVADDE